MNYTPFNQYVIVKQLSGDRATASGIILTTTQGADRAKVIAAYAGSKAMPGDTLMVRWANALKIDSDTFALDEKDIVCKLD